MKKSMGHPGNQYARKPDHGIRVGIFLNVEKIAAIQTLLGNNANKEDILSKARQIAVHGPGLNSVPPATTSTLTKGYYVAISLNAEEVAAIRQILRSEGASHNDVAVQARVRKMAKETGVSPAMQRT